MIADYIALVMAALIDSVNPCTFAIFFFLMGSLIQTRNITHMISSASSFIGAIFISYVLIGFGLIQTYKFLGLKEWFYYLVGAGAIIVGLINLRDYFKNKGGSCNYN